jgi:hypothetical protein
MKAHGITRRGTFAVIRNLLRTVLYCGGGAARVILARSVAAVSLFIRRVSVFLMFVVVSRGGLLGILRTINGCLSVALGG